MLRIFDFVLIIRKGLFVWGCLSALFQTCLWKYLGLIFSGLLCSLSLVHLLSCTSVSWSHHDKGTSNWACNTTEIHSLMIWKPEVWDTHLEICGEAVPCPLLAASACLGIPGIPSRWTPICDFIIHALPNYLSVNPNASFMKPLVVGIGPSII